MLDEDEYIPLIKISEIIEDNIKDKTLTLSDNHSLNINDGSGLDSIEFRNIEFDYPSFIFKNKMAIILWTTKPRNSNAKIFLYELHLYEHLKFFREYNVGYLSINKKNITQIHIEKIHKTLDIDIGSIKTITFTNCKFDFLPTILFDKIWQIEFNNCEINDTSSDWISYILRPTNKNKTVYFNDSTIRNFTLGYIDNIQYYLDKKLCNFEFYGGIITDLSIKNIEITSKIYINKQCFENDKTTKITNLNIKNAIFKEDFKLHHCEVTKMTVINTDFEKYADFENTTFGNFLIEDTIYFKSVKFKGLALFGHCIFNQKVSFRDVTFEDFSHFRNATFKRGLDLDYANITKEMNFFGIKELETKESIRTTSQETYRIIKYKLDNIGNTVDANKFFSLEMQKHKDMLFSLPKKGNRQKRFVFGFNSIVSNFGQNYIKPIVGIFIFAFVYKYIVDNTVNNFLGKCFPTLNDRLITVGNFLDSLVVNIGIIKRITFPNYEFISIIFYIIFSVLIWQTVVAIKRHTKR